MILKENILTILNKDVKPAIGCTEPVAISLATAASSSLIEDEIKKIELFLSPNVYKNGMNVGIPNIDAIGLDVAAALGAAKADYSSGLEILGDIQPDELKKAKYLISNNMIKVNIKDTPKSIYIESTVITKNSTAKTIIEDKHDNITLLSLNGMPVTTLTNAAKTKSKTTIDSKFFDATIKDIISEIESLDFKEIESMLEGLEMNISAAKIGMSKKLGIGIGYAMHENMEKGIFKKDLPNLAMMMTAAASDARMSGLVIPIMSSNGSGNHGLTAILPIAAYAELYNPGKENLARALAISHTITGYIKHYIGRLSPLCGCSIAASTGASCGIVWLMGGNYIQIQGTIKNMLANQSGVVCDGAKPGCALKLGTAAASAAQSALFALNGFSVNENNGIVTGTTENSIKNLGILSKKGLLNLDNAIIEIMQSAC